MSRAQLDKFIGLVSNDPAVLQEASKEEQDAQKFVENVVQYANQHGYEFTEEEANEWIAEQAKERPAGELSDTQLDRVAGGEAARTRGTGQPPGECAQPGQHGGFSFNLPKSW